MKSVTLIAPKSNNKTASEMSVLTTPLSGLLTLATMLQKNGYEIKFYDESIFKPDYEKIDSDYILISSMSATVNRAYELADYFRNKKKKVVMGGLHVSFKPNEALNHCDKVVIGEGENVLFDILKSSHKQKIVKGTKVMKLDDIPLPDYKLVEGLSKNPKIVSICSSRGCPFNCKFCSLKSMFGNKYRAVSTDRIIKYLLQFKKLTNLCFDEPNFTANKQRVVDLFSKMIEHNISSKYAWPSVSIEIANYDKILKLCGEIAEFNFLIGLESINKKVLDSYNKKQTPDMIRRSIKKIHDYGIKVQGSFIFGSNYDDKTVFKKTVDFCHEAEIDFPGFFPLTPYVGTEIRKEFEQNKQILNNNWDYYDGAHVVINPANMTPYELQEGVIESFENFYSRSKIFHHFMKGQFFYGIQTMYFRFLIKKIVRQNYEYLEYLSKFSS